MTITKEATKELELTKEAKKDKDAIDKVLPQRKKYKANAEDELN